jgi:hypothetical protein
MEDPAAMNKYRRLDDSVDFGDVPNRARVDDLTQGHFGQSITPAREVTIEVYPEAIPDFHFRIFPGCAIWLDYSNENYHIYSAHEVVSIELESNTETEETVTLNLNQIYPMYQEPAPPPLPLEYYVATGGAIPVINMPPEYYIEDNAGYPPGHVKPRSLE